MRKQRETDVESALGSTALTPRWIKLFGVVVVVLALLVGLIVLGGDHGPGAHAPGLVR